MQTLRSNIKIAEFYSWVDLVKNNSQLWAEIPYEIYDLRNSIKTRPCTYKTFVRSYIWRCQCQITTTIIDGKSHVIGIQMARKIIALLWSKIYSTMEFFWSWSLMVLNLKSIKTTFGLNSAWSFFYYAISSSTEYKTLIT